jgi:WD40 repeat protein
MFAIENLEDTITIRWWDVSQRKLIATLTGHNSWVSSVAFSPDGRMLASGSYDDTIRLWDVLQRKLIAMLTGHTKSVTSVAFSPDGRIIASGSTDDTIRLWDVSQRKLIATLTGHTGFVYSVAFSPDGRMLASGSVDGTIRLWDASQRKLIATLTGHTGYVYSVAFSPDGSLLASGSHDKTIRLWDVSQRKLIATLTGHTYSVSSVAFSPDGSLLASGSGDGTILLWDMEPYIPEPIKIAKVTVQATPNQLPADGKSTSTITVQVEDAQGNPVITGVELDANGISKICWMFDSPYDDWVNTQSMGKFGHEGDDYYADDWARKDGNTKGQIAYAGINGQVILLPFDPDGYGNHVVIYDGSSKFALRYAHLDEILVEDGQNVIAGYTPIGKVGSTGLSTGPHLHVVLYKNVSDPKSRPITIAHVPMDTPEIEGPTEFAAPFLYNPIVTLTATSGKVESPALNQGGGAYTSTYTAFSTAGEVTITATTSNGKKGTVTITLTEAVITSGFTTDSDGYSFRNFSDPSLFVWDVFRDTFGKEQVEYGDTGIHKPIADIFFVEHYLPFIGHQILGGGVCNGMAATSLLFFENPSTLAQFSATAQNTNLLEPTHELKYHIEVYQGYQLGLLIKDWKANQDKDPATLFNIIKNSLKKSLSDQQVINIYGKYKDKMAGHSVVPYKIEEKGNNIYWVYVYDSNYPYASGKPGYVPGQENRKIVFNLDKHFWGYELTSGVIWTGDDKNQWMNLVPLAFYHEQPILIVGPFATADYGATQSIEGAAHLLFEDSEGHRLGYVNGELVSEIPGAIPILASAETDGGLRSKLLSLRTLQGAADVPYPETYYISKKAKLQPKILETGKGSYDFSIYTTNTMFKLDDVTTAGDGADMLEVGDDENSIKFSTTAESKRYTAVLIREQKDVARSYAISDTTISQDGEVVFQASDDLSSFSFVNKGSSKTFDLNIEQSGTEARAFVAKDLSIGANETQKVEVQNWSKLEQVPLIISIDKGNDGTVDDVQTVKSLPTWDVNCDGRVDIFDLALVVTHFGERIIYAKIPNPDVNRDGIVDISDLVLVGRHLGK